MNTKFIFYMVHNTESMIFENFQILHDAKEFWYFDLRNEGKFYIIHGTSYRNFDNGELPDYGSYKIIKFWYLTFITKTNFVFYLVHNIETLMFADF